MKKTFATEGNLPNQNLISKSKNALIKLVQPLYKRTILVEIICAVYIVLFIYTGLNKMLDYSKFKFEMGRSPFIQSISGLIAATLPAGEMLIALSLIIKKTRLLGLYFSFFIMSLFTGYIRLMLNYAYDLPCSCGGVLAAMSWHDHLVFNIVFTALSLIGINIQSKLVITK